MKRLEAAHHRWLRQILGIGFTQPDIDFFDVSSSIGNGAT